MIFANLKAPKVCNLLHALSIIFALSLITSSLPTASGRLVRDAPLSREAEPWDRRAKPRDLAIRGIQSPSTAADHQVRRVIEILAGSAGSKIPGPLQNLNGVESQLQKGLRARGSHRDKIQVFFIIYGGSNGDVPLLSSVLQGMLDRPAIFDVKHAIVLGDSYRDFFPEALKGRFAHDNQEWASKVNPPRRDQAVAMFIAKMSSILHGWSPDLIVASHFIPPSATTPDQRRQIQQLTAPSRNRILVELQVFYLPGLRSTTLTVNDIKPDHVRIYAQQPEIWDNSAPNAVGAAMVGRLPRLSASSTTTKPGRQGEVYTWIDKQGKRPIFYMGMGMKERQFDKAHAFPAFMEVAKQELAALTGWSFIILHNIKRSESDFRRTTHNGRVFHLFVGETSWATLFPEMSMVLTHGGVGSMTDAIAAGVPQIILPTDYAADQTYFAQRLERMRIGVGLPQIPYAALSKPEYVSVKEIRNAFSKIKNADKSHYANGIRPFKKNLADTKTLDNTFELLERMCAGLIART